MKIYDVYDPQTKAYKKTVFSTGLEQLSADKLKREIFLDGILLLPIMIPRHSLNGGA